MPTSPKTSETMLGLLLILLVRWRGGLGVARLAGSRLVLCGLRGCRRGTGGFRVFGRLGRGRRSGGRILGRRLGGDRLSGWRLLGRRFLGGGLPCRRSL